MPTKQVQSDYVNNPGKSKAGKTYYNIKAGEEVFWAKKGQLDGLSNGDLIEVTYSIGDNGGNQIVSAKGVTNGAGAKLESYRQNEAPSVVDGKCVHGLVVAFIGAGLVALDADAIAQAYQKCANGYHRKGSVAPYKVQSGPDLRGALDDEVPYP